MYDFLNLKFIHIPHPENTMGNLQFLHICSEIFKSLIKCIIQNAEFLRQNWIPKWKECNNA